MNHNGGAIKTVAEKERVIPIADCIHGIIGDLCAKPENKLLTMHEKAFYNDFQRTLERLGIRSLTRAEGSADKY